MVFVVDFKLDRSSRCNPNPRYRRSKRTSASRKQKNSGKEAKFVTVGHKCVQMERERRTEELSAV